MGAALMRAGLPVWGRHAPPAVIAHRGASAHATENTLAAFRLAEAHGADGVELDAMRCGSGEIVVFHDDDLVRLTGARDAIFELSLAELRRVRLPGGQAIPTLDEVYETLGARMLVNVELKTPMAKGAPDRAGLRLAEGVARVLARHGATRRSLVSSFNPLSLARFRTLMPRVATGLLFAADQARPLRQAWSAPVLAPTAMHPERVLCTQATVARWRRRHLVHVWTVDDPAELRRLAALGVDAVICNDPRAARAVLEGDAGSTPGAGR